MSDANRQEKNGGLRGGLAPYNPAVNKKETIENSHRHLDIISET